MEIVLIAAVDINLAIGKDGTIPWDITEDLKCFKEKIRQNSQMKSKSFNLISNFEKFNIRSNFIFSALNLAFIAYFFLGLIKPSNNLYLWCDGIFGKIHSKKKKIPGSKSYKYHSKSFIT